MTNRELKKIAKDLIETNENWAIQSEYRLALVHKDIPTIQYFLSMGRTARHSIMNINDYRHGLKFGFTEVKFNESGWLENTEWLNEEKISIDVCRKIDKHYSGNSIDLAMGKNGRWAFALHYTFGSGCGGGWAPNVYGTPFKSREEAIKSARTLLNGRHQQALQNSHSSNSCDHLYIRKVIDWLKNNQLVNPAKEVQLSIF